METHDVTSAITSTITSLELRTDQIDIWLVFADEIRDDALLTQYRTLLSDDERAQEKRFYFERDQHRYLLTRALVRSTLSRYAPQIRAEDWRFDKNDYGRPSIANDKQLAHELSFNISHTLGLVVLAVTHRAALGIDVENLQRRQVSLGVADRFFAPGEVIALNALAEEGRPQRFFEYWTLKESYIKARSMGLSIPLDQFEFHFPTDDVVSIAIDARLQDANKWDFWQLRLSADHLAAVCVNKSNPSRGLRLKKIVPLVAEEVFSASLLRQSK